MHTRTLRRYLVVLVTGSALVGAAALPQAARAEPKVDSTTVSTRATASTDARAGLQGGDIDAAVRAYWSPERMKSARNADTAVSKESADRAKSLGAVPSSGPAGKVAAAKPTAPPQTRAAPGNAPNADNRTTGAQAQPWWGDFWSPPATTTGKVFFTGSDGWGYVCSGSAVNTEARNAVITAGHCVGDGAGHWHTNWVFVPDYNYGYAPFGMWTARDLIALSNWFYYADFRYDIAAVVLNTNAYGQRLVDVVGGQGYAWNQGVGLYAYAFGYPAEPPFNGESLYYCSNYTWSDPWSGWANVGIDCDLNGGSSGGPWLAYFDGYFGYINGVNSYTYSTLPGRMYSPYFGDSAATLYNAARYLY
jgi:V8-like Glu-specific endopeptidase